MASVEKMCSAPNPIFKDIFLALGILFPEVSDENYQSHKVARWPIAVTNPVAGFISDSSLLQPYKYQQVPVKTK